MQSILGSWIVEAVPYGRLPRKTGGICVIHRPPRGSLCALAQEASLEGRNGDQGDPGLRNLIAQGGAPLIILCGHVHRPEVRQEVMGGTVIVNPGLDRESNVPHWALLDLSAGVVTFGGGAPRRLRSAL